MLTFSCGMSDVNIPICWYLHLVVFIVSIVIWLNNSFLMFPSPTALDEKCLRFALNV